MTRCASCGEQVRGDVATLDALLCAASASTGDVRVVYTATARVLADRIAADLERARAAVVAIETEIARVAK